MNVWESVEDNLITTINIIFDGCDVNCLSEYEKRKKIFEYLTNNLEYDYDLLERIRDFVVNGVRISRDPIRELNSVIFDKKGICNAISQYYKLLLEVVGIKSYCVICDDGTEVKHQLNLVYDSQTDSYSFDDVTSVIVGRGSLEEYFDYDLLFANKVNQGNKDILGTQKFVVLPEEYINYLVSRSKSLSVSIKKLPDNIVAIKSMYSRKGQGL